MKVLFADHAFDLVYLMEIINLWMEVSFYVPVPLATRDITF